jgi:hypothetical protein
VQLSFESARVRWSMSRRKRSNAFGERWDSGAAAKQLPRPDVEIVLPETAASAVLARHQCYNACSHWGCGFTGAYCDRNGFSSRVGP